MFQFTNRAFILNTYLPHDYHMEFGLVNQWRVLLTLGNSISSVKVSLYAMFTKISS